MRKRRKKINSAGTLLLLLACTVPAAISAIAAVQNGLPSWEAFARDAAVASALYSMPERSIELLEERFNSEIFDPDEGQPDQRGQAKQPPVAPPKETPLPKQESQKQQEPAETEKEEETEPDKGPPPEIPKEYQGEVIEENFSISGGSTGYLQTKTSDGKTGAGFIKNSTSLDDTEVQKLLEQEDEVSVSEKGPQVLIMHTHATESFEEYDSDTYDTRNTWRTTDNSLNIVSVGEKVAEGIRAHGIEVLHDETQHDYPSYNGSYDRSAVTVQEYLEKYPTISVVLDVHRDAVQRGEVLVKPVTEINGKKTAQIMIIAGCDDGTMDMPNWRTNFRFAAGLQNAMESAYPGLTRPVFFCYRRYNQQMTTGSLLIEFGSHGNTLEEVMQAGEYAGDAIGAYLEELQKKQQ